MEVGVVVIGEHRKNRNTCSTHQPQCLLINPILYLVGLRIDKKPLWQNHIQMLDIVLQGDISMLIPVYIPCRTHTDSWIVPLTKVFLCQTICLSNKSLFLNRSLRIVIVHLLLLEEVAERLIKLCRLVILGIRRCRCYCIPIVVTERHLRTSFQGKHCQENDS